MTEVRGTVSGREGSALDLALSEDAEVLRRAGLARVLREVERRDGVLLRMSGRDVIDFASNDYLGLASDPRVAAAAAAHMVEFGAGAGAARLVSGNHAAYAELEVALAGFKRSERALLFPSGYAANTGAIPALVGKRDVIYADELNHASLIDGCRLSRAEVRKVPHCDIAALRAAIRDDAGRFRRSLIVVDSVFSMDGDLYPLSDLVRVARDHGAWSYVDDAHGTGVLGASGRGAAEHWGVEGEVDVIMGTLGKALGVSGAFIAGSATLIEHLVNRARTFVYTTGSAPALARGALEALRIAEHESWRREQLQRNARLLRDALTERGHTLAGESDGHIVPLVVKYSHEAMRLGAALFDAGYLVGAIRPPTVPMGQARLRITVSALHSDVHIRGLVLALERALQTGTGISTPGPHGSEGG